MSEQLINIVLDLETLGTAEDAAIIQIGCCIPNFDRKHVPLGLSCEFEATIKYEDARELCRNGMFTMSNDTMEWWEKQLPSTRAMVFSGQSSYTEAFDAFDDWLDNIKSGGADVAIWGNGSDFDNRLLTYSLDAFGYHKVWDFRNNRDLRTLRAVWPLPKDYVQVVEGTEIKHTALGDARYEARLLNATAKVHNLGSL